MPGNYLAFFSSFEYLQQVAWWPLARFHCGLRNRAWTRQPARHSSIALSPMAEVWTAVLGGAFGEGGLPGTRLIGAFVATLVAQVSPVNEQFKQRLGRQFGAGFDYAYLYPGVRKVIRRLAGLSVTTRTAGCWCLLTNVSLSPGSANVPWVVAGGYRLAVSCLGDHSQSTDL
jgi:hypothetical protein